MTRLTLLLAMLLATPTTTHACWLCRRPRPRSTCQVQPRVVYQRPRVTAPVAVRPTPQVAAAPQYQFQAADGPAAFLAAVNGFRAFHGRPALSWDPALAACAASNVGVHAPGSSGGGSQCWAGTSGYLEAFRQWQGSPAHAAILLNATVSVGVSPCPSGMTCNAR